LIRPLNGAFSLHEQRWALFFIIFLRNRCAVFDPNLNENAAPCADHNAAPSCAHGVRSSALLLPGGATTAAPHSSKMS
jgi:hypothetical protein